MGIIDQMPNMAESEVEPVETDLATKGRFIKWFLTVWPELNMEELEEVLSEQCKWWVIQREQCPTTERLHYHFACHLKAAKTFAEVKRMLKIDAIGTAQSFKFWGGEAGIQRIIKYCSKEETRVEGPWSGGDLPNKRRRAGEVIIEMIDQRRPDAEIVRMFPFQVRNLGLIRDGLERTTVMSDRDSMPEVWFVHGAPGVGKTRKFFDMCPDTLIVRMPPTHGTWFFNGYRQQRCILFDDANPPTEDNIVDLLRVLDRYPMTVDVKGGHVKFNSPIIGFTSNETWDEWIRHLSVGHKLAIARRFAHIENMV